MFVFENVPGILSAKNGEHFDKIKKSINEAGYNFEYKILNAKDFGVLQDRKRVIIIGWKANLNLTYPDFKNCEGKIWHVDHIFPIQAFLDHGILDLKTINRLDNLRPVLGVENLSKADKYDKNEFLEWLNNEHKSRRQ
jgi:site-specific DNA-cytosine methylase